MAKRLTPEQIVANLPYHSAPSGAKSVKEYREALASAGYMTIHPDDAPSWCAGAVSSWDEDDDGWRIVRCSCGHYSNALPDDETAADWWGDHRIAHVLAAIFKGRPEQGEKS